MGRGSGEKNSIDEPIQRTQAGCGKSIVIRQLLVMRLGTCEREFLIEVEWKLIFSLPQYRYLIPVTEGNQGSLDLKHITLYAGQ